MITVVKICVLSINYVLHTMHLAKNENHIKTSATSNFGQQKHLVDFQCQIALIDLNDL